MTATGRTDATQPAQGGHFEQAADEVREGPAYVAALREAVADVPVLLADLAALDPKLDRIRRDAAASAAEVTS